MYDDLDNVRHAETPELAREALIDSAVLIYKSQIEVAFREQTAGHNALLLFVGLALQLMEEQLYNAFKELGAKEAEVLNFPAIGSYWMKVKRDVCRTTAGDDSSVTWAERALMWEVKYLRKLTAKLPASSIGR